MREQLDHQATQQRLQNLEHKIALEKQTKLENQQKLKSLVIQFNTDTTSLLKVRREPAMDDMQDPNEGNESQEQIQFLKTQIKTLK